MHEKGSEEIEYFARRLGASPLGDLRCEESTLQSARAMSHSNGKQLTGKSKTTKPTAFPTWNLETLITTVDFLDTTNVGVILHDEDGVVLECNSSAAALFGTTADSLVGRAFLDADWGVVQEDGSLFPTQERPEMITLREGTSTTGTILGFDVVAKSRRWLRVNTCLAQVDGDTVGVISSFIDVTDQIQREHTMRLMHAVNRLSMTASDETELLQLLCDEIVAFGDYSLAWIGEPSEGEAGVVDICYAAGKTGYLYKDIVSTLAWKETGVGPTGVALLTNTVQVANDLKNQQDYGNWCSRAAMFGLSSSVAVPFHPGGRLAVLSIYDRHPFVFDPLTVQSLQEITREVEQGVTALRSVLTLRAALEETSVAMVALAETERSHGRSEQRFRLAFEDNMAPMVFSDSDDLAIAVNDAFCEMVGFSRDELLGRDSSQFTYPDDVELTRESHESLVSHRANQVRYVKRYLRKDGQVVISEVSRSTARDETGQTLYYVSSERDITAERELASKLSHQALHDPLTGLANRVLLDDRLIHARARAARQGGLVAVLMIDLDDFKGVNDTYGHLVGDQLLSGVAERFGAAARPSDTLCRFGGDEFLYLAEGLTDPSDAEDIATRFLATLEEPFRLNVVEFTQHATIGIVVWDVEIPESYALIQNADVALYEAKRRHKGSYSVFDASMRQLVASRFTLKQELLQSMHNDELSMRYQPIMDLETQQIVGFEALMRWDHPVRGAIGPDVFIPVAEQSDMILELGAFALREATCDASTWAMNVVGAPPYVSVNLAAQQLSDPQLMTKIDDALRASGLAPERLVLEITETSALFDVAETLNVLKELRSKGIDVALDDFGTGYSSLSYLVQLDPKVIKIDRSFVSPLHDTEQTELLLETIISLGEKLNVTLLAEGIETQSQLSKLIRLGCRFGQGFLFSRAVASRDVGGLLVGTP
jgi:diguanylate cyclase (GGDEF)-like protein/PAS domain S-box-containing protein